MQTRTSTLITALVAAAGLLAHGLIIGAPARASDQECLTNSGMRAAIAEFGLTSPASALRSARSHHASADVVGMRLCREGEAYHYLVTLLRRDGMVLRVSVDAGPDQVRPDQAQRR